MSPRRLTILSLWGAPRMPARWPRHLTTTLVTLSTLAALGAGDGILKWTHAFSACQNRVLLVLVPGAAIALTGAQSG